MAFFHQNLLGRIINRLTKDTSGAPILACTLACTLDPPCRAPMALIHQNPQGRIINRRTKDTPGGLFRCSGVGRLLVDSLKDL